VLELIKSQKFQADYQAFHARIEKIADGDIKNQATILLKTWGNEVRKLDNQHQEMFSGNKAPSSLGDTRSSVVTARKKLDTLLKDWERVAPKI
jgi:hypothetical protein